MREIKINYLYFYVSHFMYTVILLISLSISIFLVLFILSFISEASIPDLHSILSYIWISFYASGIVSGLQFVGFVIAKALYIYGHAKENGITVREIHERGREYMERVWSEEE